MENKSKPKKNKGTFLNLEKGWDVLENKGKIENTKKIFGELGLLEETEGGF